MEPRIRLVSGIGPLFLLHSLTLALVLVWLWGNRYESEIHHCRRTVGVGIVIEAAVAGEGLTGSAREGRIEKRGRGGETGGQNQLLLLLLLLFDCRGGTFGNTMRAADIQRPKEIANKDSVPFVDLGALAKGGKYLRFIDKIFILSFHRKLPKECWSLNLAPSNDKEQE